MRRNRCSHPEHPDLKEKNKVRNKPPQTRDEDSRLHMKAQRPKLPPSDQQRGALLLPKAQQTSKDRCKVQLVRDLTLGEGRQSCSKPTPRQLLPPVDLGKNLDGVRTAHRAPDPTMSSTPAQRGDAGRTKEGQITFSRTVQCLQTVAKPVGRNLTTAGPVISDGARGKEILHCPNSKPTHNRTGFRLRPPAQPRPKSPAPKITLYGEP